MERSRDEADTIFDPRINDAPAFDLFLLRMRRIGDAEAKLTAAIESLDESESILPAHPGPSNLVSCDQTGGGDDVRPAS